MSEQPEPTFKSKYRGVSWHKKNKKFQAQLHIDGKYIYLGSFANEEAAAMAWDKAVVEHRKGVSAQRLNFPERLNIPAHTNSPTPDNGFTPLPTGIDGPSDASRYGATGQPNSSAADAMPFVFGASSHPQPWHRATKVSRGVFVLDMDLPPNYCQPSSSPLL